MAKCWCKRQDTFAIYTECIEYWFRTVGTCNSILLSTYSLYHVNTAVSANGAGRYFYDPSRMSGLSHTNAYALRRRFGNGHLRPSTFKPSDFVFPFSRGARWRRTACARCFIFFFHATHPPGSRCGGGVGSSIGNTCYGGAARASGGRRKRGRAKTYTRARTHARARRAGPPPSAHTRNPRRPPTDGRVYTARP